MKTVRDVMTTDVVWVSPSARVKTAVILMKGHSIGALPVVHADDAVVGMVTYHSLLGEPQDAAVMDVMQTDYVVVEPDMRVYEAAETMHRAGVSHLLVLEEGRLVGIVSHSDLIPELGKTFDPLTELPWSDTFREWAIDALKRGMEISVIFYDLDQYGMFNKKHGHVVGDRVLKEIAGVLRAGTDPELDLVCRYGGDEFAIASVRRADQATELAEQLQEAIARVRIPDVPEGPTASCGLSGGRRTKERTDIHYAATIDDLITRASKECTSRKPHRAPAAEAAPAAAQAVGPEGLVGAQAEIRGPRLRIQTVTISTTAAEASVGVTLERGGRLFEREVSGYAVGGTNTLRMVAEATAGAACKSVAPGHGVVVDEVIVHGTAREEQIVTVVASFIGPRGSTRHVGSAVVRRGDPYRAVAAALLSAVNRQLENAPEAEEPAPDTEEPEQET
mgnify:CR=1 FL=1